MADIPPKIKARPVHTIILNIPKSGWKIIKKAKIKVRIPPVNTHPQLGIRRLHLTGLTDKTDTYEH